MRVFSIGLVWVALSWLTGCGVSTEQRVAWYESRIAEARAVVETIDARLEPALEQLAALRERLDAIEAEDPGGALTIRLRAAVEEMTRAVEAAQLRRVEVLRVIDTAEASVAALRRRGAGWGDELVAAGEIGGVVAPLTGPVAPWVALGSHLAALLGGLLIRRPGDVSGREAKQREDGAWDEADGLAYNRGHRIGVAEGRLEATPTR